MELCSNPALGGHHSGIDDGKQSHLFVEQADALGMSREGLGNLAVHDAELKAYWGQDRVTIFSGYESNDTIQNDSEVNDRGWSLCRGGSRC